MDHHGRAAAGLPPARSAARVSTQTAMDQLAQTVPGKSERQVEHGGRHPPAWGGLPSFTSDGVYYPGLQPERGPAGRPGAGRLHRVGALPERADPPGGTWAPPATTSWTSGSRWAGTAGCGSGASWRPRRTPGSSPTCSTSPWSPCPCSSSWQAAGRLSPSPGGPSAPWTGSPPRRPPSARPPTSPPRVEVPPGEQRVHPAGPDLQPDV